MCVNHVRNAVHHFFTSSNRTLTMFEVLAVNVVGTLLERLLNVGLDGIKQSFSASQLP